MEFLRVAFSLFFRGEERQGSVKKKDCGDAASIEKETKKVRNRGKRKKRSALIYFFIFLSFLLPFFLLFFFFLLTHFESSNLSTCSIRSIQRYTSLPSSSLLAFD